MKRDKEIERDRERDVKDKEKKFQRELSPSDNIGKADKKLNRISSSREHSNYSGKIERSPALSGFIYPLITEVRNKLIIKILYAISLQLFIDYI